MDLSYRPPSLSGMQQGSGFANSRTSSFSGKIRLGEPSFMLQNSLHRLGNENDLYNSSSIPRTVNLTTATHGELIGSGNMAYIQLYTAYMKMESKNESLNNEVANLRKEVAYHQKLTDSIVETSRSHMTSKQHHLIRRTSTSSHGNSRSAHPKIPRSEDREDYPNVPFWSRAQWMQFCEEEKDSGRVPDRLGFLTDEEGNDIDKDRIKMMMDTAKTLWNGLKEEDMAPLTWKRKSDKAGIYFSSRMLTEFIEFRLDNGLWKIELFATIKYPDFTKPTSVKTLKRPRNNEGVTKPAKPAKRQRASSPPPGAPVIEIDVDDDQEAPSTSGHLVMVSNASHSSRQPTPSTSLRTSNPINVTTQRASTTMNTSGPSTTTSIQQPEPYDPNPSQTTNTSATPAMLHTHGPPTIPTHTTAPAASLPTPTLASQGPTTSLSAGPTVSESTLKVRTEDIPPHVPTPSTTSDVPSISFSLSAEPGIPADTPNHAPQRPVTRRALNPLKNLNIPPPTNLVPPTGPANDAAATASLPKKSNPKFLKVKEGVTTARNLFLIDYLNDHPNSEATEGQFTAIWKACDTETRTKYEELSKTRTKERKKAPPAISSTSKTTGGSAACSGNEEPAE